MRSSPPPVSPDLAPGRRLLVGIELSSACNFRCPICPHGTETAGGRAFVRKRGFMAEPVFERLVDECQRVAERVELGFFGEQTLHPRYKEWLARMADRSFALELNTNLSRVDHAVFDAWVESRVDLVRLSIDAADPDVFDRARPGPVHDLEGRPAANRLAAIEEKARTWLARPDHRPTRLVFVRSSHNPGEQDAFVARWQPLLGPQDTILTKQVLTYGGIVPDPEVNAHRCNIWLARYLVVDIHGDASPCNLDVNLQLHLGNVMSDSLAGLYQGAVARWLRTRTGCGNDLAPCRSCVDGNNWSLNEEFRAA